MRQEIRNVGDIRCDPLFLVFGPCPNGIDGQEKYLGGRDAKKAEEGMYSTARQRGHWGWALLRRAWTTNASSESPSLTVCHRAHWY